MPKLLLTRLRRSRDVYVRKCGGGGGGGGSKTSFSARADQYGLMLPYRRGKGVHSLVAEERRRRLRSSAVDMFSPQCATAGSAARSLAGERLGEGTKGLGTHIGSIESFVGSMELTCTTRGLCLITHAGEIPIHLTDRSEDGVVPLLSSERPEMPANPSWVADANLHSLVFSEHTPSRTSRLAITEP